MKIHFQNHEPSEKRFHEGVKIRNWIQLGVLLLTLAVGIQFAIYVDQLSSGGPVTVRRPPGVEGFLPIGGLAGWKLFLSSGVWDPNHPAALVILGFSALISILLRKSFCAWFCPVGAVSEGIWKTGRKLMGKSFSLPSWVDIPMRGLKYLLLGFFLYAVLSMSSDALAGFLDSPYYKMVDVKMLHFFTRMSPLTAVVIFLLTVGSFFIPNAWCRYLCPYGALMGILAVLSPTRIERREDLCSHCKRCSNGCPSLIPVDRKHRIRSPECTGCMDCTLACPAPGALSFKSVGLAARPWSPKAVGASIAVLFVLIVLLAELTGHWQSRLPQQEARFWIRHIEGPQMAHPGRALPHTPDQAERKQ